LYELDKHIGMTNVKCSCNAQDTEE